MSVLSLPIPPRGDDAPVPPSARSGREVFSDLVELHSAVLYRVARALGGSDAEAQDAVQDAYVDAWRRIESLRDPASGRAWLLTILRGRIRGALRWRASRPFAASASLVDDDVSDPAPDAFDRIDDRETLDLALASVAAPHREALVLVFLAGLSPAEAADQLGVPKNTVLSRLHRGRAALRAALSRPADGGRA